MTTKMPNIFISCEKKYQQCLAKEPYTRKVEDDLDVKDKWNRNKAKCVTEFVKCYNYVFAKIPITISTTPTSAAGSCSEKIF